MSQSLANKYRPKKFPDLIGQRLNAIVLQRMVETHKVPSAILFSGPSGVGKTTAARVLAAELNPESSAFETIEIDAASHGGVADIRSLIEGLRYSTGSDYRVVILDEVHSLSRGAFDALLTHLEDPPLGTIFVLVTTEPEKIPETILSRLREWEFRRVSASEIFDRLIFIAGEEQLDVSSDLIHFLAQSAQGNVRKAVMSLDQVASAEVKSVSEYVELIGEHDASPTLLSALLTADHANIFAVLDTALDATGNPSQIAAQVLSCLRDLLVLKSGGLLTQTGPSFESRKELAYHLETERILAACKILWDLKTRVRGSDNPRGNLELSLILMSEVFSRGKSAPAPRSTPVIKAPAPVAPIPAPEASPAPRKLSLADLQRAR